MRAFARLVLAVSRTVYWWTGFALVLGGGAILWFAFESTGPRPLIFTLIGLSASCMALAGWLARPESWAALARVRATDFGSSTFNEPSTSGTPSSGIDAHGVLAEAIEAVGQPVALLVLRVVGASLQDSSRPLARVSHVVRTWVPSAPQYQVAADAVAVLVPSAQVRLVAPLVANRSRKALGGGREVRVGVSFHPDDGRDLDSLARAGLTAIASGGAMISVANPESARRAQLRDRMANELRAAIRDREIVAHFQVVADARTMRVVGAEALARWMRGAEGVVEASEFVAATAGSGTALDLGARMMRHACRLGATWRSRVERGAFVSVNLSDTELRDRRTLEVVAAELEAWKLPARALRVEVPYGCFEEGSSPALAGLLHLADLGVSLWMDITDPVLPDLEVASQLGLAGIKVPAPALLDEAGAMYSDAVDWLESARQLDLLVHVTRIESATDLRRLCMLDAVRYVQGYAVFRPMPPGHVPEMLGQRVEDLIGPARV